jgi:IMP dehydrogenase
MSLMFTWNEIESRSRALTYDDVLLVPQKSDVKSRKIPDLSTQLTKELTIQIPFVSANMDTITEAEMAIAIGKMGGLGILHRFLSIDDQIKEVEKMVAAGLSIRAASIGVNFDAHSRTAKLIEAGVNLLTIDIAHGHSVQMFETLTWVKSNFPKIQVIAGNVATPDATMDLIEAGADAVKVGIGPGSMCTTRIITGCGVPQLTAVAMCAKIGRAKGVPIIADGGIKTSGDAMKALAAGADSIMLGSLLSGTIETPGPIRNGKKQYRGMASKAAQVSWRGELPEGMAAEGEATAVAVKGHVETVVHELCGGIRSGMSYVNATRVSEIHEKSKFMEMSPMGFHESRAHGVYGSRV